MNPKTILLVDDTPENIDVLVGLLKNNYRLMVAKDGHAALKLALHNPPDLIMLDIMMPGMDGYEVCRQLQSHPPLRDIPVIFVSALSQVKDKVKAFTSGGVDYVTKPFQAEEVEARVATHLRIREQQLEIEIQKDELQESYEKLTELEELRDSLVHMIVHDMRSPLAGLCGQLELFTMECADKLSESEMAKLKLAKENSWQLSQMVTMLLDISCLEAGEMPVNKAETDVRDVIDKALNSLGSLTGQCELIYSPPKAPISAEIDQDLVRRIVVNLVGNSLKFTPPTGVVYIELSDDDANVKVTVTDSGPGIPKGAQHRIFDKFGQLANGDGKAPSSGLGLTFCKLAVEAHGGEIGVNSKLGEGSQFWFTLPRKPDEATSESEESSDEFSTEELAGKIMH